MVIIIKKERVKLERERETEVSEKKSNLVPARSFAITVNHREVRSFTITVNHREELRKSLKSLNLKSKIPKSLNLPNLPNLFSSNQIPKSPFFQSDFASSWTDAF